MLDTVNHLRRGIYQLPPKYPGKDTAIKLIDATCHYLNSHSATNIYQREWDVLILLDCARVDMLESLTDEFPFIHPVGTHHTPGTDSAEWMETTFVSKYEDDIKNTVYITANPNSENHLSENIFERLEEVWRYSWDDDHGTVLPRSVTDQAITISRDFNPEKMIIHYMQPHPPFIPRPEIDAARNTASNKETAGMNLKSLHQEAGYSLDELWEAHMENLNYVLKDIQDVLLTNLNADKVVISADHGQAFGEQNVFGHPRSIAD
ncbi:MAG: hypothetical protein U5K37_08625 [Natrialbaceae archaeon]|nr:hypothetical protein [Natrialbaceae archaeon]